MNFKNRTITQTLTPEYIHEIGGVTQHDEIKSALEDVAKRFERSYPAVAMVEEGTRFRGEWVIRIIPKHDADMDVIGRGTQELYYWLDEASNDDMA